MGDRIEVVFDHTEFAKRATKGYAFELAKRAAQYARNEMLQSMGEPKTGRDYRRPGYIHRASAPGEAPAIDTGALAASLKVESNLSMLQASVETDAPQARKLEEGGAFTAPRPFMGPAYQRAYRWIADLMVAGG